MLGGSRTTRNAPARRGQPPLLGVALALGHRLGALLEEGRGDAGRTALVGDRENADRPVRRPRPPVLAGGGGGGPPCWAVFPRPRYTGAGPPSPASVAAARVLKNRAA